MIIHIVTIPKNIANNCRLITFFKIKASGREIPTIAIIKASAVPIGTPFATSDSIMGMTPLALEYKGTAKTTARGTPHQPAFCKYFSKNH